MTEPSVIVEAFDELRRITPEYGHGLIGTLEQLMLASEEMLDGYASLSILAVSNVVPIRRPELVGSAS